jgi:5-methylcytosine-specific restriction endonuclease McrA
MMSAKFRNNSYMGRNKAKRAKKMRSRLSAEQNHKCCYCGKVTDPELPQHARPTIEHVIPFKKGGTDDYDNLVMACWSCNNKRGQKTYKEHLHADLPALP